MGLDMGKKTIGVAISDEFGLTAQPVTTIKRTSLEKDFNELASLIEAERIDGVVVGLPINMDGSFGEASKSILKFVEGLKARTCLPVGTWDERLSTSAVTKVLLEGDVSRARRKAVVDKLAAAYILQGFLDSKKPIDARHP